MCWARLIAALLFREFKARAGSAPIVRFVLGVFAMIGALAFLGCPWRALLRLAGGDLNAIVGLAGLAAGIAIGVQFLKAGYNLGRSHKTLRRRGLDHAGRSWSGCCCCSSSRPKVSESGALFFSESGPGSHARPAAHLAGRGLDHRLSGPAHPLLHHGLDPRRDPDGRYAPDQRRGRAGGRGLCRPTWSSGRSSFGFFGQPVAHSQHLWNFLGMVLAGLAFALAGGCPGRQLFLSGEGDGDAAVFVLGMITGAALCAQLCPGRRHRIGRGRRADRWAASGPYGMAAVVLGLVVCVGHRLYHA